MLAVEHGHPDDHADDRVLDEALVVAHRIVVRAGVRAATLLPLDARDDHALGEVEQEAELDRLREVAVEDLALVLDEHALVAVAEAGHDPALLLHLVLAPEDAEVLVHRGGELVAGAPRALAGAAPGQSP